MKCSVESGSLKCRWYKKCLLKAKTLVSIVILRDLFCKDLASKYREK